MTNKTINFYTNEDGFANELLDVAKLFFPHAIFEQNENTICDIVVQTEQNNDVFTTKAAFDGTEYVTTLTVLPEWTKLEQKRFRKRSVKIALYNCLKKALGAQMPWGSLTGIRPTKLAYELLANQSDNDDAGFEKIFAEDFDVSENKISLVEQILNQQKGLRIVDDNTVDIYVGIPFCTSRCSYCSFTSGVISKLVKHVKPYVDNLVTEINDAKKMVFDNGYKVRNVYFGGGTPTSLCAEDLDKILSCFDFQIDEFTVEAGRPDTIDEQKLAVLAKHGVNRISINPQTFNQTTLEKIGRSHTVGDIIDKFNMARKYDFAINMDLIAGLPDETAEMFYFSVNKAISLEPDNITVHTLALKRGSILKEADEAATDESEVTKMVDFARAELTKHGYFPYYMYRQKYVSANLENVGYAKPNKQCKYNIDIMEETTSIVACGCNAISKRVFTSENRIERQANPKDVITYNKDLARYQAQKQKLFQK